LGLSKLIATARPLVEQLERMTNAKDIVRTADAEIAFINENLEGIRRADLDRAVAEYDITAIEIVTETAHSGLKKYTVHGTFKGVPFVQALNNNSRVLLTAVSRRPELIPVYVLQADAADPLNALLKHTQDCYRGYRTDVQAPASTGSSIRIDFKDVPYIP
jgi:hypothetical protein